MIELHPDPARPLTSREIARLIAALLGFQLGFMQGQRMWLLAPGEVERTTRAALEFVQSQVSYLPALNPAAYSRFVQTAGPSVTVIAGAVLGTLVDLQEMVPPAEVATARVVAGR